MLFKTKSISVIKFTIVSHRFCHKLNKNKYLDNIILPKTSFPLRLRGKKLVENDQKIYDSCFFDQLYAWQRINLNGPDFILHDGPPYANGVPHMGHAINKILKDIVIRQKVLIGQRVNYIPGWDCHGLPIELKALHDQNQNETSAIDIRTKARKFAKNAVMLQKSVFRDWGVMADWENEVYMTNETKYITNQIRQFYKLFKLGFVYRDVKPVYWSPSSRTALAEAELEYNSQHISQAVTLRLKIKNGLSSPENICHPCYLLIWTTTPWTLPANQGVCYNPNLSYSEIKIDISDASYIVATDLISKLQITLGYHVKILRSFNGTELEGVTYEHPVKKTQIQSMFPAEYVSASKGTGLVHTAPAHGPEDFLIALSNNIQIVSVIADDGTYTEAAGDGLCGLPVLSDGMDAVIDMMKNNILHQEDYVHSYPYDWRTKQPVIIKASHQWFIDTNKIKDNAVESLADVNMLPEGNSGVHRHVLIDMIKSRAYWCISRQRVWGVPIPVFYNKKTGVPLITETSIDHICKVLEKHGTDGWWTQPLEKLVSKDTLEQEGIDITNVIQGQDILDIWLDSGLSWSQVVGNDQVADLYLEGVDQTTGWFQSSLLTSVALRNCAPYKNVFIHGFAVDKLGRKMSKSLGNVIDPQVIVKGAKGKPAYGVDVLRWWVACHGTVDSKIPVSEHIIQSCAESVQKIRSVMRYLLSNLHDFPATTFSIEEMQFRFLDHYILHQLYIYSREMDDNYRKYMYNRVCKVLLTFVTNIVSALYCHLSKNLLYCETLDNPNRLACQYVFYQMLNVLNRSLAPVMPHLAEEIQSHLPYKNDKQPLFCSNFAIDTEWYRPTIDNLMENILKIKTEVNKAAINSNTLRFHVTISAKEDLFNKLKNFQSELVDTDSELAEILQVSKVTLVKVNDALDIPEFDIDIKPSDLHLCSRCRRFAAPKSEFLCNLCDNQTSRRAKLQSRDRIN